MKGSMRSGRIVLLLLAGFVVTSCGGQDTHSKDLPASLRQSDRLLGKAMAAMDRSPAAPESSFAMPTDVQAALEQAGFLAAPVRVYAQQKAAEQRVLDARWKPVLARARSSAARARRLLAHQLPGADVSPQFLRRYGELAKAIDDWVTAESMAANDVTHMTEAFRRAAAASASTGSLQQAYYEAMTKTRAACDRSEAAVDRADRASAALSALLSVDRGAADVASALIDADSSGLLARKWRNA